MRNFSTIANSYSFATINCGDEYYEGLPSDIFDKVIVSLAKAFESPLASVRACSVAILKGDYETVFAGIAPMEHKAICDATEFLLGVATPVWELGYKQDIRNATFVYVNLNTGSTVTWHAMVM